MQIIKAILTPAALVVLAASAYLPVQAATIDITNPSFETGGADTTGTLAGWTAGDSSNFYYTRQSGDFIVASVGDYVGSLVGNVSGTDPVPATLSQTTTFTAALGDTFTLAIDDTYDVGSAGSTGGNAPFALTIGGVAVAFNPDNGSQIYAAGPYGPTGKTAYNELYADSLTYTVTDSALVGKLVGVELLANKGQYTAYFDDVRLDVQTPAVPEPSTYVLALVGIASCFTGRRYFGKGAAAATI